MRGRGQGGIVSLFRRNEKEEVSFDTSLETAKQEIAELIKPALAFNGTNSDLHQLRAKINQVQKEIEETFAYKYDPNNQVAKDFSREIQRKKLQISLFTVNEMQKVLGPVLLSKHSAQRNLLEELLVEDHKTTSPETGGITPILKKPSSLEQSFIKQAFYSVFDNKDKKPAQASLFSSPIYRNELIEELASNYKVDYLQNDIKDKLIDFIVDNRQEEITKDNLKKACHQGIFEIGQEKAQQAKLEIDLLVHTARNNQTRGENVRLALLQENTLFSFYKESNQDYIAANHLRDLVLDELVEDKNLHSISPTIGGVTRNYSITDLERLTGVPKSDWIRTLKKALDTESVYLD